MVRDLEEPTSPAKGAQTLNTCVGSIKSRALGGESGSVPLTVKVLPEPLQSDLATLHSKTSAAQRQTRLAKRDNKLT